MITCKTCHKFAKLNEVFVNGLGDVLLIGSCKHCGYKEEPKLPKNFDGSMIEKMKNRIDFDDFDELGIEEQKQTPHK